MGSESSTRMANLVIDSLNRIPIIHKQNEHIKKQEFSVIDFSYNESGFWLELDLEPCDGLRKKNIKPTKNHFPIYQAITCLINTYGINLKYIKISFNGSKGEFISFDLPKYYEYLSPKVASGIKKQLSLLGLQSFHEFTLSLDDRKLIIDFKKPIDDDVRRSVYLALELLYINKELPYYFQQKGLIDIRSV